MYGHLTLANATRPLALSESTDPPSHRIDAVRAKVLPLLHFDTENRRMKTLSTRRISAFVASTNQDPKRKITMRRNALDQLAAAIRGGEIPLQVEHDSNAQIDVNLVSVDVREAPDGTDGVFVEVDVSDDQYNRYRDSFKAFSIGIVGNKTVVNPESDQPFVGLYPDASYDQESVDTAVRKLSEHFRVATGPYFQFSEVAPIVTILELAVANLATIPPGILSAWIYDALKGWLTADSGSARHVLRLRASDGRGLRELELETPDDDIMKQGFALAEQMLAKAPPGSRWLFDQGTQTWQVIADIAPGATSQESVSEPE
jgi:hypothetical protein